MSPQQPAPIAAAPSPAREPAPGRRASLVDIVRDFIAVHIEMKQLFERFRSGSLRFEEVRSLVADGDSSALFRLKERVHSVFRHEADDTRFRRGEALFDLAVGSLFHEALKFRENFYQLEVYGPKILALRREDEEEAGELLAEFEKILGGASARLGESLEEADTLLDQTRTQLLVLLIDSRGEPSAGLVTRYLIAHRDDVEAVYPDGLDGLLVRLHEHVSAAYLCAIRSQLESARFAEVIELIAEAAMAAPEAEVPPEVRDELRQLEAYARGMQAFLEGDYSGTAERLSAWVESLESAPDPTQLDFALAALRRIPDLASGNADASVRATACELVEALESRS